jgi:hypothetical protein
MVICGSQLSKEMNTFSIVNHWSSRGPGRAETESGSVRNRNKRWYEHLKFRSQSSKILCATDFWTNIKMSDWRATRVSDRPGSTKLILMKFSNINSISSEKKRQLSEKPSREGRHWGPVRKCSLNEYNVVLRTVEAAATPRIRYSASSVVWNRAEWARRALDARSRHYMPDGGRRDRISHLNGILNGQDDWG